MCSVMTKGLHCRSITADAGDEEDSDECWTCSDLQLGQTSGESGVVIMGLTKEVSERVSASKEFSEDVVWVSECERFLEMISVVEMPSWNMSIKTDVSSTNRTRRKHYKMRSIVPGQHLFAAFGPIQSIIVNQFLFLLICELLFSHLMFFVWTVSHLVTFALEPNHFFKINKKTFFFFKVLQKLTSSEHTELWRSNKCVVWSLARNVEWQAINISWSLNIFRYMKVSAVPGNDSYFSQMSCFWSESESYSIFI